MPPKLDAEGRAGLEEKGSQEEDQDADREADQEANREGREEEPGQAARETGEGDEGECAEEAICKRGQLPQGQQPLTNTRTPAQTAREAEQATEDQYEDPDAKEQEKERRRQHISARMQAACDERERLAARKRDLNTEEGRTARRERLAKRKARRARRRPVPGLPACVSLNSDDDARTSSSSDAVSDGDPPASRT